jgi:hypothetical protein
MAKQKYQGYVMAGKGFLLGGTRLHKSSWFGKKSDAQHWTEVSADINRKAGRDVARTGVIAR